MSLNDEIEESSKRIEVRQSEITIEIGKLSEQINKFTVWAWIFVGFGALLGVFSFIYFLCRNTDPGFGLNLLGDFMAGTVASIWSLSGLFFIYVAFLGQKQQLLNQQLEIMYSQLEVKYTRLELSEQKLEMRAQNETLLNQKFENTFFQLLTLFNSIVNSMDLRRSDSKTAVISQGRDCFEIFYRRLKSQSPNGNSLTEGFLFDSANIDDTLLAFDKLYINVRSDLSHYFRTFYHIIKFIDNSTINNKLQYIAIARAQLSSFEQVLLFYNCLHKNGRIKFKPLIERYAILKNIDDSLLFNLSHKNEYEMSAFKLN